MSANPPSQPAQPDAEAARLEAALDRIAQATAQRKMAADTPAVHPETKAIAARLDRMIADLRGLLGTQ